MTKEGRTYMGTPEDAKINLAEKSREWRQYRQPHMATASEHRKRDILEREALHQLGNAALLWLWHEENPK